MMNSLWGDVAATTTEVKTRSPRVLKADLPVDQVRLDAEVLLVRISPDDDINTPESEWPKAALSRASSKDVNSRARRDAALLFLQQQGWIDVEARQCEWRRQSYTIYYRATKMGREMARMIKNAKLRKIENDRRHEAETTAVGVQS